MGDNTFALTWDNFENSIIEAFRKLRNEEDFYDCTIVCKDSKIGAHRVILSAFSPSFRDMIRSTTHHHPVLYLRGVRVKDLEGLLDFMYHGEVFLEKDELDTFLKTAEDLKVQGLCHVGGRSDEGSSIVSAINEDVQNLLETLDEPASKRIKRDPEKTKESSGLLSSLGPGLSVSVKREPGGEGVGGGGAGAGAGAGAGGGEGDLQSRRRSTNSGQSSLEALRSSLNSPAGSAASDTQETLKSLMLKSNTTPLKTNPHVSSSSALFSPHTPVKFTTSTIVTPVKVSQPSTPLKTPHHSSGAPVSSSQNSSPHPTRPVPVQKQSFSTTPGPVQSPAQRPLSQSNTLAGLHFQNLDTSRSQVSSPPVLHLPEIMSTIPAETRYQISNSSQAYQVSSVNNSLGYQISNTSTGYQIVTSNSTPGLPPAPGPGSSTLITTPAEIFTSSSTLTVLKDSTKVPHQFSGPTLVPTNLTSQTLSAVLTGHARAIHGSPSRAQQGPGTQNTVQRTVQNQVLPGRHEQVGNSSGNQFLAQGQPQTAGGNHFLPQGQQQTCSGNQLLAQGQPQTTSGNQILAQGQQQTGSGNQFIAQGQSLIASGNQFLARGQQQTSSGNQLLAQGQQQTSSGNQFLAHGQQQTGSGNQFLAQGQQETDSGNQFLAQGQQTAGGNQFLAQGGTDQGQDQDYQRLIEDHISRVETPDGPVLQCKACPKTVKIKNKHTMISHVEAVHLQASLTCSYCNKNFKATNYLKQHLKRGPCGGPITTAGDTS